MIPCSTRPVAHSFKFNCTLKTCLNGDTNINRVRSNNLSPYKWQRQAVPHHVVPPDIPVKVGCGVAHQRTRIVINLRHNYKDYDLLRLLKLCDASMNYSCVCVCVCVCQCMYHTHTLARAHTRTQW